jgi:hypothetical protein
VCRRGTLPRLAILDDSRFEEADLDGHRQLQRLTYAIAAMCLAAAAGCGTAVNSSSSSSSSTLQAQPATGPILGYVWDAGGQALRPVQGVPGASLVGKPVVTAPSQGAGIIASASSGISATALFLDANGGVFQAPLSGGSLTKIASVPGATSLAMSSMGSTALVTGKNASGAMEASLISGLPQTPSVRALTLPALASILGGAASDTGTAAVAGSSAADGPVSVFGFSGPGAAVAVATLQAFGGMQFVPGSDKLVVADAGSGALTAISNISTTATSATLSPAGAIAAPAALDITANGRWVVAANHAGDVLRLDLTGAVAATKLHCSCSPSQVSAFHGSANGTAVRLITADGGPLWMVDAGTAAPRILFIPAIRPASTPPAASRGGAL